MSAQDTYGILERLGRGVLRRAISDPNIDARATAVQKICHDIRSQDLTEADRKLAEKLLERVCEDVSDIVRRALAITLRNSANLPPSVARRLIADIDSIALPVLANSPVLTDADLVAVLKSGATSKIKAVAQRQTLSSHICTAIISFGDPASVAELAANDGAVISPRAAEAMVKAYANDDLIREAALSRADFPPALVAKLVAGAAQTVERNLRQRDEVGPDAASGIAKRTRERALVMAACADWTDVTLTEYISALSDQGALDERLLLRAAGLADFRFLQLAFAKLCGTSLSKAGLLLFDKGPLGLTALCRRGRISEAGQAFLQVALRVFADLQTGDMPTQKVLQSRMAERLLTSGIEMSERTENDLLDHLDSLNSPRAISA